MKLLLHHGNVGPRPSIERLIESRLLALATRLRLEEAIVRLEDDRAASLRYRASVLLRVPGPDLHTTASHHTVRVTVEKALAAAEAQVAARQGRRIQRRQPLPAAGARSW